jgi:transposase
VPSVRKTWAPRGHTPLLRHWTERDKLSVISALSVSPQRRHLGLYYQIHPKNIQQPEVVHLLRHLLRHLRGAVILLWDSGRPHGGPPIRALLRRYPRLRVVRFPTYAPELNPDEGVWGLAKRALANGRPETLAALTPELRRALERVRRSQRLLRGCVRGTPLPLFLP